MLEISSSILGTCGNGIVFKGSLKFDNFNIEVAVKRLSQGFDLNNFEDDPDLKEIF